MTDCVLWSVLKEPVKARSLSVIQWNLLLSQARRTDLLAKLAILVENTVDVHNLPGAVQANFVAAKNVEAAHRRFIQWELRCLEKAFERADFPVVVLKGAAYTASEFSFALGRVYSDIDLLVPKQFLQQAENRLWEAGWMGKKMDEYDVQYYRQWMHEIPPLQHMSRGSAIDLHHSILPPVSKLKPSPEKLLEKARPIKEGSNLYVFEKKDMLLHSAAHLFHEGEFDHGPRDLLDLNGLMEEFTNKDWQELIHRARELDLVKPLNYAINQCHHKIDTDIPQHIWQDLGNAKKGGLMFFLFDVALEPIHSSCDRWYSGFVRWLLYVRSHYLRMPMYLLIPHLIRKAWMRRKTEEQKDA